MTSISPNTATMNDVRRAESVVRRFVAPTPWIRSYALEKALKLPFSKYVWLKDYGSTPSGSFKVMGALNWVDANQALIGDRPVAAHSSGNFASGLAYACQRYAKRAIIVMPDNAPKIKFQLTRSFGAEVRTYEIARDHETGDRDRLTEQISREENAVMASPYDDNHVIAGNGVGAMEIVADLRSQGRPLAQFLCPISGGGLLAGQALAIAESFPEAEIVAVEPDQAADFQQSLAADSIQSLSQPQSICDGLLSYRVGDRNWPILRKSVSRCQAVSDLETKRAMRWMYDQHGLRTEPSGAIAVAALLSGQIDVGREGDIVVVLSGRNIDHDRFAQYLAEAIEQ